MKAEGDGGRDRGMDHIFGKLGEKLWGPEENLLNGYPGVVESGLTRREISVAESTGDED